MTKQKTYITNVGNVKIVAKSFDEFKAKIRYAMKCQMKHRMFNDPGSKYFLGEKNVK
mgnify:CR=1 FL=1